MWTLECDGDSLARMLKLASECTVEANVYLMTDKKIWLRPGKRYLFGRTKEQSGRDREGFSVDR